MKAEGIYLKIQDASGLFDGFNSYMNSSSSKDLVFPVIDGSEVQIADYMFSNVMAKSFSGFLNFGNIKSARQMFSYCRVLDGTIPEFDSSKIEQAESMFNETSCTKPIPDLDFSSVIHADSMFRCSHVFDNGYDFGKIKFPNATCCSHAFRGIETVGEGASAFKCSNLTLPKVT